MEYKITIIIPYYNAEKFLDKTIDSIINQSMNFEDIQIILINNKSKDASKEKANSYVEKYSNIKNINLETNNKFSVIYNSCFSLINGKYVTFSKIGVFWESKAFESAFDIFESTSENVVVAGYNQNFNKSNIYFFDKAINFDDKFFDESISLSKCFFKSELIKNYEFCDTLHFYEDINFLLSFLLDNPTLIYGKNVVCNENSNINFQNAYNRDTYQKEYVFDTVLPLFKPLINKSTNIYGEIIKFLEYTIYDIIIEQINKPILLEIPENDLSKYINDIGYLLNFVNDNIIYKKIQARETIFLLKCKYGLEYDKSDIFDKIRKNYINSLFQFDISSLDIRNNKINIYGQMVTLIEENSYTFSVKDNNNKKHKSKYYKNQRERKPSLVSRTITTYNFDYSISLENITKLDFIVYFNEIEVKIPITFGKYGKLSNLKNSYYVRDKKFVKTNSYSLFINDSSFIDHIKNEIKFCNTLFRINEYDAICLRVRTKLFKLFKRKELWITADKMFKQLDNSFEIFKYVSKEKIKDIDYYYASVNDNLDNQIIQQYGKTLDLRVKKEFIKFLASDKVVVSYLSILEMKEIWKYNKDAIADLFDFDLVYIGHGILHVDLRAMYSKFKINAKLCTTAGIGEQQYMAKEFGYRDGVVKLTGLARYDYAYNCYKNNQDNRNIVLIAPTWRTYLSKSGDKEEIRVYDPNFKNSDFFKFYQALITNDKFLKALEIGGYKALFKLHPMAKLQMVDFQFNNLIEPFVDGIHDTYEFKNICHLITDYSSIAFDYAYINVPIIYCQFDKKQFYSSHTYSQGYFDFERDGFGKVCYDFDTTIIEVVKILNNNCIVQEEYQKRTKETFAYVDNENCKRIYKEIKNI